MKVLSFFALKLKRIIATRLNFPLLLLLLFPFYFTYNLYTGRLFFSHNDFAGMYYPFRQWFLGRILTLQFPVWNPYWGIGHEAVIWSTVPIDPYTIFELLIGPRYKYFFLIQCLALVLAGYYVFKKLKLDGFASAIASLLFFMSPLVTYWYFEFINTNTFIAHMFVFLFILEWLQTGKWRYVFLLSWSFFLGMFGTKLEFWFFELVFFTLLLILAFFVIKPKKISMLFIAWFGIFAAILAQSWQINLLINALNNSGRLLIPHGLGNITSLKLYKNIYLSLVGSQFFFLMIACLILLIGIHKKFKYRLDFIAVSLIIFAFFKDKFTFLPLFLQSPVFLGAILASLISFRRVSWRYLASTWVIFMLPAYYWFKPLINFDETYLLRIAPFLFKITWGFFVWFGCLQVHRNKIARLAYLSIILILFLESQGQIVSTYLFGIVWIAGRDNYLIDFSFVLIAALGTLEDFRFKRLILMIAPFVIIFSSFNNQYYMLPEKPVPEYANSLLRSGLKYNPFRSIPDLKQIINSWEYKPYRRAFDPDIESQLPQNQGTFLLERVSNVTFYGSMKPSRYSELVNFYNYGVTPQDKIAGYPSTYSENTISLLPKLNNNGLSNNLIYYFTVWTIPPPDSNLLKLLGIEYIVTRDDNTMKTFGKSLKLEGISKYGDFNTAKLSESFPRSFLVSNVTEKNFSDFNENMRPSLKLFNSGLTRAANIYLFEPATIIRYEPEYVEISVDSFAGGYLVLTDAFHPYWSATVDDKKTEIIPAFHAFRSVKVLPGMHKIKFFCGIKNFNSMLLVSFVSLAILAIGSIYMWRKEH